MVEESQFRSTVDEAPLGRISVEQQRPVVHQAAPQVVEERIVTVTKTERKTDRDFGGGEPLSHKTDRDFGYGGEPLSPTRFDTMPKTGGLRLIDDNLTEFPAGSPVEIFERDVQKGF